MTLLFSTAPLLVPTAAACSCGINPPCAAAWQADTVFVGTVLDRASEVVGGSLSWTVYRIAVTQALRGSVDPAVTLVPRRRPSPEAIAESQSHPGGLAMMSTCDYRFQPGQEYVIYARRTQDGRWTTSLCSGTKPLEEAAADLEYLENIPLAEPIGRVYGAIERTLPDPSGPTTAITCLLSVSLLRSSARTVASPSPQMLTGNLTCKCLQATTPSHRSSRRRSARTALRNRCRFRREAAPPFTSR